MEKQKPLDKETQQMLQTAEAVKASLKRRQEALKKEYDENEEVIKIDEARTPEGYLKRLTKKTREEVLSSGTPQEVGYLIAICYLEEQEGTPFITEEETITLNKRLSDSEKREVNKHASYILALNDIELRVFKAYLNFQRDACFLAFYVAKWREWEKQAEALTDIYRDTAAYINTIREIELTSVLDFEKNFKEILFKAVGTNKEVGLNFYSKEKLFSINLGRPEEGFMKKLREREMWLKESMKDIKKYLTAAERYLKTNKLRLDALPLTMYICRRDMKREEYLHAFEFEKQYYRSYINDRISKTQGVTRQDIERAVFPDYYEIEVNEGSVEKWETYLYRLQEQTLDNMNRQLYRVDYEYQ